MSYKLDVSDNDIKEKILDVLSNSPTDWVHLGYTGGSNTKLKVVSTGSDGFSEMLEELNEGKVQYFYVRFSQGGNLYKYVYIAYVGEGASGMLRGNSHNHTIEMNNFLKTIRAPVHVQVNARNEGDLNEDTIQKQCRGAMGANYDAGAKNQGVTGGVKNIAEGVKLHKDAQEESVKYDKRALPFIPDADSRQQFWSQHNSDAARNKGQAGATVINEDERKKFWEQQQKEEAERKAQQQHRSNAPVVATGASSLAKQFESTAQPATAPPVQSTGKKWTPPPASSKPPPVAAKPPPVAAKPPPVSSAPPPISSPPPSHSAPPPAHAAPPPAHAAPPPAHSAPPPISSPPPVSHPAPPPISSPPPSHYAPPPSAHPPGPPPSGPPPGAHPPGPPSGPPPGAHPPGPPSGPPPGAHPPGPPGAPPPGPPPSGPPSLVPPPVPSGGAPEWQDEDNWDEPPQDHHSGGYDHHPPAPGGHDHQPPPVPPPSHAPPPGSEAYPVVVALYPFEAEQPTDLSFNEGDHIWILDKTDPSGWWRGRDQYGNEGYFPMNFIQEL